MAGKVPINLILLMSAVSVVISCLVTNCPRGGKRGKPDFRLSPDDVDSLGIKKCKLCSPGRGNCLGENCNLKASCGNESRCFTKNLCCLGRLCEWQKFCASDFHSGEPKEFQLSSLLLTKILRYNL